jgi:hypothetical protein
MEARPNLHPPQVFLEVWAPSPEIKLNMSMLFMLASTMPLRRLQVFLEVWGEGGSWEELFESIRAYPYHLRQFYEGADQVSQRVTKGWSVVLRAA